MNMSAAPSAKEPAPLVSPPGKSYATLPVKAKPKPVHRSQTLGQVRDYFAVQLDQDTRLTHRHPWD